MTNTICKKVSSMLSLYIDNKVTYQERSFIEEHLSNCKECYKKYLYLKSLIKNLKDSYKQVLEIAKKKQKKEHFSIREYEKFQENLSPYIDNELDAQSCFEFRKYLIKSKVAQKELKNIYIIQKEMRNSYERSKRKMNFDASKYVISKIKQPNSIKLPESKIIDFITKANPKTLKIAILSGLIIFTAAELRNTSIPVKIKKEIKVFKELNKKHLQNPLKSIYKHDNSNLNIDKINP